jgi:thiamine biosynthesis lipoprotein
MASQHLSVDSLQRTLRASLILVLILTTFRSASSESVTRQLHAMGTRLEVVVEAPDRATAVSASEAAVRAVSDAEQRLSTWRTDSEISRLNHTPVGSWIELSPELASDLRQVTDWWHRTDGSFHPGLAALVQAWNLRGDGRRPTDAELAAALEATSMDLFELDGSSARRLAGGFGIEEGGFGKGVALRDAAAGSLAVGASCVAIDLGGQLHLAGHCAARAVSIAHPDDRDRVVATLPLTAGSVATSGNSERAIVVDGRRYGHLLDPSTGFPASDFGAVTVVARDPLAADCLATALFVLGPEAGLRWADAHEGVEVVYVVRGTGEPQLRMTDGLRRVITANTAPIERAETASLPLQPRIVVQKGGSR